MARVLNNSFFGVFTLEHSSECGGLSGAYLEEMVEWGWINSKLQS